MKSVFQGVHLQNHFIVFVCMVSTDDNKRSAIANYSQKQQKL